MTDASIPPATNPYASPTAAGGSLDIDPQAPPQAEELRAFVGRNADYYLKKWGAALKGFEKSTGFNFAALVFGGVWLAYRKMYRAAFILYGIVLADALAQTVLFSVFLPGTDPPPIVERAVTLGIALVCGGYGNRWYLNHSLRQIADARAEGLQGEALMATLSKRGRTNLTASLGMSIGFFTVAVAVLVLVQVLLQGF
jgi:hypothetical protein